MALSNCARRAGSMFPPIFVAIVVVSPAAVQDDDWRTLEFETTGVTATDVTVSPDGQWLRPPGTRS